MLSINILNETAYQYNITAQDKINSICEPLFKSFNLESFRYCRFFYDGSYALISSNKSITVNESFSKLIFNRESNGTVFEQAIAKTQFDQFYYFLWPSDPEDALLSLYHHLNIWNGFTIYLKSQNYLECWCFAATKDQPILSNFYINNVKILHQFIKHFHTLANEIVQNAINSYRGIFKHFHYEQLQYDSSYEFFKLNNSIVFNKHLSPREIESLHFLLKGMSNKEIARKLGLSCRTIEDYVNSIKNKLECKDRKQLLSLFVTLPSSLYPQYVK